MRTIACLVILLLTLTGCSTEPKSPVPEKREEPTEITLTPIDLFKGEAAKFKPFLGNMSGGFKLRYEGNKPNANLDVDIWKNGEKVTSACSILDLFFQPENSKNKEIEIIASIQTRSNEGQDDFNEIKVTTVSNTGTSSFTCSNEWNNELTAKGLISMGETYTFTTENTVHLWGMQATSTNQIYTADFSPESLSMLEQAIILTLRFED